MHTLRDAFLTDTSKNESVLNEEQGLTVVNDFPPSGFGPNAALQSKVQSGEKSILVKFMIDGRGY